MPWIKVKSKSRFALRNVAFAEQLLGRRHHYQYDGRQISVVLPTKRHIDISSDKWSGNPENHGYLVGEPRGSSLGKNNQIVHHYSVYIVDVFVDVPRKLLVSSATPDQGGNLYRRMSHREKRKVERLLRNSDIAAKKAYSYWLRVLRWKTRSGLVGQPEFLSWETPFSPDLINVASGKSVGYNFHETRVLFEPIVKANTWEQVRRALKAGADAPLWTEILFEGENFLFAGNLRAALAYFAFACESYIRTTFLRELDAIDPPVQALIDRQLNLRRLLDSYIASKKKAALPKGTIGEIQELMDWRNKIVHRAAVADVSDRKARTFNKAVRALLFS